MNKLVKKENIYNGRRFKVFQKLYEREDGLKIVRDCVEPGNAVIVIAINENNEVFFIEQYRETIENVALELPAGMIEEGEEPKEAARRELEEETGIKAKNIEYLTSYFTSAGYTSEKIYIYLAKNLEYGKQHLDETEEILSIKKIHIEDCMKMILEDKVDHASVYVAIQTYYYKYYNGGKNG